MPDPRAAAVRLTARERAVLIQHLRQAADRWSTVLPAVAGFWTAVADQLAEVAANPERQVTHHR